MNDFATSLNLDAGLPQTGVSSEAPFSLHSLLKLVQSSVAAIQTAWVTAEVISVKRAGASIRFELAESDPRGTRIAKVEASLYRDIDRVISNFRDVTGDEPKAGMRLLARVKPKFHPNYGMSLDIETIDPSYTLGEIEAARRERRRRLQEAGIFDLNKRFVCPEDFRKIAVVSPNEAAALGDFRQVADKLSVAGLCRFEYYAASFQGRNAPDTISQALHEIVRAHKIEPFCAVCIIRGGGSFADLAELDHFLILKTTCHVPIPVLTGIGHERDNVLLDEIASRRFDTPSKVALHIEKAITDTAWAAKSDWQIIRGEARRALANARHDIDALRESIATRALSQSAESRRALDTDYAAIAASIAAALPSARTAQEAVWQSIAEVARRLVRDARRAINTEMEQIVGLGPKHTLARGFAIVRDADDRVVTNAAKAAESDELILEFRDGRVAARRIPHGD